MRISGILRPVVLVTLVVGCSSATDGGGPVSRIVVDPGTFYLEQGATRTVSVRLVDESGGSQDAVFDVAQQGSSLEVQASDGYPEGTEQEGASGVVAYSSLNGELLLTVTGTQPGSSTLAINSGGRAATVHVAVIPSGPVSLIVSDRSPALGDTIGVTVPEPYLIGPEFALVTEDAERGCTEPIGCEAFRTINSMPSPRTVHVQVLRAYSGPISVQGVSLAYAPELALDRVAEPLSMSVDSTVSPLPGTESPETAPVIRLPEWHGAVTVFDEGRAFASPGINAPASKIYRLSVYEEANYRFFLVGNGSRNLGMFLMLTDGSTVQVIADYYGNEPYAEIGSAHLYPGTFYLEVGAFDDVPYDEHDFIRIDIRR